MSIDILVHLSILRMLIVDSYFDSRTARVQNMNGTFIVRLINIRTIGKRKGIERLIPMPLLRHSIVLSYVM